MLKTSFQSIGQLSTKPLPSNGGLVGSLSKYQLHLGVVTSNFNWPVKFVDQTKFHQLLYTKLWNQLGTEFSKVKLNHLYLETEQTVQWNEKEELEFDFLIFPNNIKLHKKEGGEFGLDTTFLNRHSVLICTHNEVDCRCGTFGLQVYNQIQSLRLPNTQVFKVSHIGGHKFAANLIHYPSGNWFGNLDGERATQIVHDMVHKDVEDSRLFVPTTKDSLKFWRGKLGWDKPTCTQHFQKFF